MTVEPNQDEFVAAVRDEVKSAFTALDTKTETLAQVIEELKKGSTDAGALKGHIDDLKLEVKKAQDRADEIERKANRAIAGGEAEFKTAGQVYAESDEYQMLVKNRGGRGLVEMKAITNLASPAVRNPMHSVQTVSGIIREPDRPLMVRDLLPVGNTTSLTIEYPREDVWTNNAAPVPENTLKPESNLTFTAAKADVATIAHWVAASRQVLDDVAMLQGYIDNRLREGLRQEEENQLLNGDGTGVNMLGIVPQATAYAKPAGVAVTAPTIVDTVRLAKLQVRKSFYAADAVVLNPEDWTAIELLKDGDEGYLFSAVTTGAQPRLWGMRVVESDSLPAGEFLLGAFGLAAQIWDRQQASVLVSTEDRDNFVKNMVTILAEERLGLTVYRPKSFVHGDLAPAVV